MPTTTPLKNAGLALHRPSLLLCTPLLQYGVQFIHVSLFRGT
jgi:hypothetical protein